MLNGGDTGEFVLGNGRDHLVQPPFGVVGTEVLVRLGRNAEHPVGS